MMEPRHDPFAPPAAVNPDNGHDTEWTSPKPEEGPSSWANVAVVSGSGLTLWGLSQSGCETAPEQALRLDPDLPVIVGRQEGGSLEYLDTRYCPTQIVPTTGQRIVRSMSSEQDKYVSRGHFMLRGHPDGVMLVNGVPRRGGGIRPPLNGTWLILPERRQLQAGEERVIGHGESVRISLPNGTVVSIRAR
jgi:hypothetical protein